MFRLHEDVDATKKFACMNVCKSNTDCAGYFIKDSKCHTLDEENKYNTGSHVGASYFKKIKQADFAKEALLQNPRDISCLRDTDSEARTCSFPYSYQGTKMYACRDEDCPSRFWTSEILTFWLDKVPFTATAAGTAKNTGECRHLCNADPTCKTCYFNKTNCFLSSEEFDQAPAGIPRHSLISAWTSSITQSSDFAVDGIPYFNSFITGKF